MFQGVPKSCYYMYFAIILKDGFFMSFNNILIIYCIFYEFTSYFIPFFLKILRKYFAD